MEHTDEQVEEFRAQLGDVATEMSDREVDEMLSTADRIADVLFDSWMEERDATMTDNN